MLVFKKHIIKNIKSVVFVGYILLFLLVLLGLYKINKELVNFSRTETIFNDNKELKLISSTLLTLYQEESKNQILLSNEFSLSSSDKLPYYYDDKTLTSYIDSLYSVSNDVQLHCSLDTVSDLLIKKRENLTQIMNLMEAIRRLPYSKIMSREVVSKQAVADLTKIIAHSTLMQQDTTLYIKNKKNFLGKVKSVFTNEGDSVRVVSKSHQKKHIDSVYMIPSKIVADTVVTYVNTINALSNRQKVAYVLDLSHRQTETLFYDKLLTEQIKTILLRLEQKEKERVKNLAQKREDVIKNSSWVVSTIAILSLLVLIFFISLSFYQINKMLAYGKMLEKKNKEIDFLAKNREKLLLMISHDIKAPLSSILGHIELLAREKHSEEEEDSLNNMRSSSEQILDLSNRLLQYYTLEKGESRKHLVIFDPYVLINDICSSYHPVVKKKRLIIECDNKILANQNYKSDPFLIRQILNNLISNALKFTERGKIVIKADIEDDILVVDIKDTGVGIAKKEQKQIFKFFQRGNTLDIKRNIEGYGLGLAISLQLVQLLEGKLSLKSKLGKGSTFTMKVPIEKVEKSALDK